MVAVYCLNSKLEVEVEVKMDLGRSGQEEGEVEGKNRGKEGNGKRVDEKREGKHMARKT